MVLDASENILCIFHCSAHLHLSNVLQNAINNSSLLFVSIIFDKRINAAEQIESERKEEQKRNQKKKSNNKNDIV